MQIPKGVLLLDLETTGLSRENDQIISIGLIYLGEDEQIQTEHCFLEHPNQEDVLLQRFLIFIQKYEAIFTYYGKGFEFPFLLARLEQYHLDPTSFLSLKLIDMKSGLKHFSTNRLELEHLCGYTRQSQSTGYDIVKLYQTYINSKRDIYKTCILEHQKEELESLSIFLEVYLCLYNTNTWKLKNQYLTEDYLIFDILMIAPFNYTFLGKAFDVYFSYQKNAYLLTVKIPLFIGTLNHAMEPLKDYYYIESQKQLMHKSVAQFIPAPLKRKATKEECVISKSSTFVKLVTNYKISVPIWHDIKQRFYVESNDFTFDLLSTQIFHSFFAASKKGGGN